MSTHFFKFIKNLFYKSNKALTSIYFSYVNMEMFPLLLKPYSKECKNFEKNDILCCNIIKNMIKEYEIILACFMSYIMELVMLNRTQKDFKRYSKLTLRKIRTVYNEIKNNISFTSETYFDIKETDKNKVWAFNAGQTGNDYRGNPKWLFTYINEYRKDITAYWLCSSQETVNFIKNLGYRAYRLETHEAELAIERTGVYVAEQIKVVLPKGLENVKYLNLYHGVGAKTIERCILDGGLVRELAKKYIKSNAFYRTNQLFLSTSPMTEADFKRQCGIDDDHFIRAGYPRCLYQKYFKNIQTFDHDLLKQKGLPSGTHIAVYAPTFRKNLDGDTYITAIPDLKKLIDACEKNNILMIMKMHPLMEKEVGFLQDKERFGDSKYVHFWDNKYDIYEIMDKVHLLIYDYSSIFNDFLGAGVKHFIRYIFDYDESSLGLIHRYDDITTGVKCSSFDELLSALDSYENQDNEKELEKIYNLFWEYSTPDSMDKIIDETLNYTIKPKKFKSLYSFDIFDTLISRKVLQPTGIFYGVREKMIRSDVKFPFYLVDKYPEHRKNAELNAREYYNKTLIERNTDRKEITFDMIFERLKDIHGLDDMQIALLKEWELEIELDNVIPLEANIKLLKEHIADGDYVVLISDMYLPEDFIRKMLVKADKSLADIPLFLSSTYGVQKVNGNLFLEVYKSFKPFYDFEKWVHYGDNVQADQKAPRALFIRTVKIERPEPDDLSSSLSSSIGTYDAQFVSAMIARFDACHSSPKEQFAYSFLPLWFVTYVSWAVYDAIEKGYETLYFISRDGYQLKRIADAIIDERKLNIKTKYIYGSRRAWRIPSYIDEIDVGFWGGYGNFVNVNSFDKLLRAIDMDEKTFLELFPELSYVSEQKSLSKSLVSKLIEIFKNSEKFKKYILMKAEEERIPICGYLKQEIDASEKFAIVEFWGRGYTQDCFARLWHHIVGEKVPVTFYYARSVLPSLDYCIRYNFVSHPSGQQMIEAIFANMPYKSIEEFILKDGKYQPVFHYINYDKELFFLEEKYLVEFARNFHSIKYNDELSLKRALFEFALNYYAGKQKSPIFCEVLAPLVDSVEIFGKKHEYAPRFTMDNLEALQAGAKRGNMTKSNTMSVARSSEKVQNRYREIYQLNEDSNYNSGKVLYHMEVIKNRLYHHRVKSLQEKALDLNEIYSNIAAKTEVEDKILLLTEDKDFSYAFASLRKILTSSNEIKYEEISLKRGFIFQSRLLKKLAEFRFIIIDKPIKILSLLNFRSETRLIMLNSSVFPVFREMLALKYRLKYEGQYNNMINNVKPGLIQLPSHNLLRIYRETYGFNSYTDLSCTGSCISDIYFDPEYAEKSRAEVNKLFPHLKNKKFILYMPKSRYRNKKSKYEELISMTRLSKLLKDKYFVAIYHDGEYFGKMVRNKEKIKGFSYNVTGKVSLRTLLLAADIIVGDYRNIFYEAAFIHKPVFMSIRDIRDYEKNTKCLLPYEELIIGPVVKDADELADKINNISEYDYSNMEKFREKYFNLCDGKSAQRLIEYIKDSF